MYHQAMTCKKTLCLLLLLVNTSAISCNKKQVVSKNTVIMGVPSAPQTTDPRYAMDAFGQNLRSLLFASLIRLSNTGPDNSLVPVPELATQWTVQKNSYIFDLRKNIFFSDGTPITNEDIRFSIETFQSPSNPFSAAFKKIKNIHFDNNKLTLTTENYESTFFLDLAFLPILPKKTIEKYGDNYYQHLIGSGPFRLVSADESSVWIERNPHSFLQSKIDKVLFKIIRDDNSRFLRMFKGDLDVVINDMPSSKVATFANSKKFTVQTLSGSNITYLVFNLRDPLLKNKNIREAITRSINKLDIIKYKLENLALVADTFVLPSSPYYDSSLKLPMYSPEVAKKIFSQLQKIPEIEIKTSNQRSAIENGKMLAYQLEEAGAQISLKSYEWGTYYADIKKGNFQIATMKAVGVPDPDLYRLMFHSEQVPPNGLNRGYYINKELNPLLLAGNHISNTNKRIEHYKKIQKVIIDDLPMVPLWYDKYVAILNKRIVRFDPSPQTGFGFLLTIEKTDD